MKAWTSLKKGMEAITEKNSMTETVAEKVLSRRSIDLDSHSNSGTLGLRASHLTSLSHSFLSFKNYYCDQVGTIAYLFVVYKL